MQLTRRKLLQASAIGGSALALPGALAFAPAVGSGTDGTAVRRALLDPPQTGFERTGTWTTHADELELLDLIAAEAPNPVTLTEIGRTALGRPLHRLTFGLVLDETVEPGTMPTVMVLGSQHGNEPAGREAALKLIRDLAYADMADPANADLAEILATQSILVVPSANPDGRAANTRTNSNSFDINRDHLRLETEEAFAFAQVVKEYRPFMALDLHEYGPSQPVVYDDDLLYLWPRNLNVDEGVRALAKSYCIDYIKADGEAAGYTADEYGLQKVGPNLGPVAIGGTTNDFAVQTAGDGDEGICRNAMGLRHTLGILVESATTPRVYSPGEAVDQTALLTRRVESQRVVLDSMLRFQLEQGQAAHDVTIGARVRKAKEGASRSAPVYFGGQDDSRPTGSPSTVAAEPMGGYELGVAQATDPTVLRAVDGQEIAMEVRADGTAFVSMGQAAEPLIPLLLDGRGRADRRVAEATPVD